MKLNTNQQQAVDYLDGPSLIIAGAGTGKTRVLTEKIKNIILNGHARAQEVLALTFTEKAASEMEERVDKALPYGYYQTSIGTFHSFADTLLRQWGVDVGIPPSFRVLTEVDAVSFFRRNMHRFKLNYFHSTGNPHGFISSVLTHFSRLRDENISTKEYILYARTLKMHASSDELRQEAQKINELALMYQAYEKLKLSESVFDFSDLVYFALQLITKRKNVRSFLQKQYRYCLVDEFQDTNIVQYDLIRTLFPPTKITNLTVIGDDNQSIYKFRGASVSNILNFRHDYKHAKLFVLNENYRSTQEILDASYALVQHNNPDTLEVRLGISKKLIADKGMSKQKPVLIHGLSSEDEAEAVTNTIISRVKDRFTYQDIAVLVRANDHAKAVIQALERQNIPFQFLGPSLLYYKNEVRDCIAFLRFISNPLDSSALFRVLSMHIFALSRIDMNYLLQFSRRIRRSLFESLDAVVQLSFGVRVEEIESMREYIPFLTKSTKDKLRSYFSVLSQSIAESQDKSAIRVLYNFFERSGYLQYLSQVHSQKQQKELENITQFFNRLKAMEGRNGESTVAEVIDAIDLALELGDSPRAQEMDTKRENAVNILTVHSAKGLEFPVVFLMSLVNDRFPTRVRSEKLPIPETLIKESLPQGDFHVQEERRLFYVGMTRAKDELYLSFADYYASGKRKKKLSPFVVEALGEKEIAHVLSEAPHQKDQLTIFSMNQEENDKDIPAKYGVERYSYSQIGLFDTCPLQYKYRYLLKVPEPDSPALSFGSSMHKALEHFYREVQKGNKPKLKQLQTNFKEHFIPVGYPSEDERKKALQHGLELLKRYYNTYHDSHGEIIDIERTFTLKLYENKREFVVQGKIDRIDKHGDVYEIIDYKTGTMPKEYFLKKSLQMSLYALAAMDKHVLSIKQDKLLLSYLYLDSNEKFTMKASERNMQETESTIIDALKTIEHGSFPPKVGRHCEWCAFKIICPAWGN